MGRTGHRGRDTVQAMPRAIIRQLPPPPPPPARARRRAKGKVGRLHRPERVLLRMGRDGRVRQERGLHARVLQAVLQAVHQGGARRGGRGRGRCRSDRLGLGQDHQRKLKRRTHRYVLKVFTSFRPPHAGYPSVIGGRALASRRTMAARRRATSRPAQASDRMKRAQWLTTRERATAEVRARRRAGPRAGRHADQWCSPSSWPPCAWWSQGLWRPKSTPPSSRKR